MLETNGTIHPSEGQNTAAGADHLSREAREAAIQLGQILNKYKAAIEYDLMKYKLTSDALGIAHWDMDVADGDPCSPDNTFTWSPEFRRMLGYSADGDFSGAFSNLTDRMHPEDKERVLHNFAASMADRTGKTPFDVEYRIRSASGEYLYIRVFGAALRAKDGTPVRIAGAVENITAQREIRENLREAEERVRIMFDTTPLAVTMWDKNFNVIDCSQNATDMFGFSSKQDLLDRLVDCALEFQPNGKRSLDFLAEEAAKAFETGQTHLEWTHVTPGGEAIVFDETAIRVKYKDDYALMLYARDIRQEKKMQAELAQRERTLNLLNKAALALLSREGKTFADTMSKGFGLIADTAGIDRMSIFRNSDGPDGLCMSQIYRWRKDAEGIVEPRPELRNLPYSVLSSRYVNALSSGEYIVGPRRPIPEGDFPAKFGCANILAVPVFDDGKFWGFTFFERSTEEIYTEQEIEVLRSASFMLSNAVIRNEEADAVREANERIQAMLDAIPLSITMWDRDFRFIDCSQYAIDLFGYGSKKELSESIESSIPEYQPCGTRSLDILNAAAAEAFATGHSAAKWTQTAKNGDSVQLDTTVIRVKHKDDYAMMLCSRDVREENRMLAELKERDEKMAAQAHWYKSILDGIPVPLSVTNRDMSLTFINTAAESVFGRERADVLGKPCGVWNCPVCNTPDCAILRATQGQPRTLFKHNGISFQADTEILRSESGDTAGYLEVLQDVTEVENMARRSADAANEAKNVFLAQMSHEMRTPLSAVIGLSELLLEKGGLSDDNEVYLDKIYNAGSTLLTIVNDILDISKIEAGKFEILPQEYDVPSLINDAVTQNILRIHSKPVHFALNVNQNVPARLCGDDIRVKQILSNLLSNAFKYTDEGRVELHIDHERDGDSVWTTFRVSDTGIGIRPDDLKRLFSDYTRFDGDSNRKIGGTGLGLSITKRLVELMDGSVTVKSEYGKGSVFTARIRQKYVSGAVIGAEMTEHLRSFSYTTSKRRSGAQLERVRLPYARVLVVDDNMTNLDIAQGLMQPYGMKIDCVTCGQAAIDAIRDEKVKYSAVFMDHMMPGMDGVEAVRIIREEIGSEYARTIPIIALTANAVAGNKERFISCGFNAFVSKPIDIFRLDSVIRKWIWNKERETRPDQPLESVEKLENSDGRGDGERRRQSAARQGAAGNQIIDGVDWAKGESLFGDEESYRRVLRSFAVNTRPLLGRITEVSRESLADYAIVVHGMKSAGRGVCAHELGAMAESLEFAAKDGNLEFVRLNNPDFLTRARKLIEDIEALLDEKRGESAKPSKDKPDAALLRRLHDACTSFDMDTIESVMREIEGCTYTGDGGLAEWLCENIAKLNYAQVAEKIMEAV